jgi:thiosulfate dehydrogenase [quinone] large subunit
MIDRRLSMDDRALARALLRVTLGINLLVHGLVRVPKLAAFAGAMAGDFGPTFLPSRIVYGFALALPFVEAVLGALVAVGLWQRLALAAGALLMLALIFGTALLQRWDTLTQQMVYSLIYAALIATLSWDRWSVDALRSGRRA